MLSRIPLSCLPGIFFPVTTQTFMLHTVAEAASFKNSLLPLLAPSSHRPVNIRMPAIVKFFPLRITPGHVVETLMNRVSVNAFYYNLSQE